MNFCPYCGSKTNDDQKYCTSCGALLKKENFENNNKNKIKEEPVTILVNNNNNDQRYNTSKILGIISIITAFIFPIIGLVLGITGISVCKKGTAKSLNTTGIVISSVLIFLRIIFIIFIIVVSLLAGEITPGEGTLM